MVVENTDPNANGTEKGFGAIFGIIVLVIVLIIGGWWLLSSRNSAPASGNSIVPENQSEIEDVAPGATPGTVQNSENAMVTYTDQGFSPKSLTVSKGTAVEFVNQSSRSLWVASSEHPTHTIYGGTSRTQHCPDTAGTSFDQCGTGDSFTFTFDKIGSWDYHNHAAASDSGIIIVD